MLVFDFAQDGAEVGGLACAVVLRQLLKECLLAGLDVAMVLGGEVGVIAEHL